MRSVHLQASSIYTQTTKYISGPNQGSNLPIIYGSSNGHSQTRTAQVPVDVPSNQLPRVPRSRSLVSFLSTVGPRKGNGKGLDEWVMLFQRKALSSNSTEHQKVNPTTRKESGPQKSHKSRIHERVMCAFSRICEYRPEN